MQLTLILDKSAFQSLNYQEIYRLCQYYKIIVPPILVTEILGDLSKEVKTGKPPSEVRVIDFAKKLFVDESVVIMDYRAIVHSDLMQHNIALDRRPIVEIAKKSSFENQSGFEIQVSAEERAINKWKHGEFSDAERELSKKWRTTTTEPYILDKLKMMIRLKEFGLNSIEEVVAKVDCILNDPKLTQFLLTGLCDNYEIPVWDACTIFQDWIQKGKPLLKEFSEYSFHCLRIDLLFIIGLTENIIGTRSTNNVDIKYLYHLPFTKIFSSADKMHKLIVPYIIEEDQLFIEATKLKEDISIIIEYIQGLATEERKQFYQNPPINDNSITFQLWRDNYGYTREDALWQIKPSLQEYESAIEHAKKISQSFEYNIDEHANVEKADYIVKQSFIRGDDPCYCKSGEPLVGCCMTIEEFNLKNSNIP